jgi:hypothetical protein
VVRRAEWCCLRHTIHTRHVVNGGLVDGILVTEAVAGLRRLQMIDQLIFAWKALAWNASWAAIDVAEEA